MSQLSKRGDTKNPWRTLRCRTVYKDPFIRVRIDDVIRPDKSRGTYSVVELKGGIGVLVRDRKERILLVGQFRYPVNKYSWEIPKGGFESFGKKKNPRVEVFRLC